VSQNWTCCSSPFASKQHVFATVVVLWHDCVPLVPQPEEMRDVGASENASAEGPMRGPASADETRVAATRAMAAMASAAAGRRAGGQADRQVAQTASHVASDVHICAAIRLHSQTRARFTWR
jgi:hypothetical protein